MTRVTTRDEDYKPITLWRYEVGSGLENQSGIRLSADKAEEIADDLYEAAEEVRNTEENQ